MFMLFQNTVEVNPVENYRSAAWDAYEIGTKMFFECAALDAEVLRCLLAVITALKHKGSELRKRIIWELDT